mmetsp:Transcript_35209/g.48097  ORF Transcript_35209/g.48097 Transcript_35209/m.48097 type:complete len:135 (-) Transcript_35209:54-458(-)|eukprot:CAMPEP_0201483464 /NCGR_PEP_ID=MMETSP0151_2-20130828/7673_1 /ASSEMBLY_ACC=CAM_ASM_000257 /TAXON_ID=200890 /ORGANISM="Paramoeba atlantica, Strain 621/1 / CCAP 1560/9" /LENGTH=134 /DNA_ID=CAMNT_0047866615 /DNA_START=581 /DNA_END=985 /DNA_ORIENTATION=+
MMRLILFVFALLFVAAQAQAPTADGERPEHQQHGERPEHERPEHERPDDLTEEQQACKDAHDVCHDTLLTCCGCEVQSRECFHACDETCRTNFKTCQKETALGELCVDVEWPDNAGPHHGPGHHPNGQGGSNFV